MDCLRCCKHHMHRPMLLCSPLVLKHVHDSSVATYQAAFQSRGALDLDIQLIKVCISVRALRALPTCLHHHLLYLNYLVLLFWAWRKMGLKPWLACTLTAARSTLLCRLLQRPQCPVTFAKLHEMVHVHKQHMTAGQCSYPLCTLQ